MLGEFSLWHWLIVFAIIFFVFGAKRMPEIGSSMGKSIRAFKKSLSGTDEVEQLPPGAPQDAGKTSRSEDTPHKLSQ